MTESIDDRALNSISVAPGGKDAEQGNRSATPDANRDETMADKLEEDPDSVEAQLDESLDESMDASDPPSMTQPGRDEPAPSSGGKA
ncbi:hypothetical protein RN629_04890 [Sphingomonadaceae bacterium jetA1]|jgi:hypothetical protein|uniref:hypothetical protein n=1 Tax=Facivitalis istanbulensis TaxID=3075838 RepID=UPI003490ABE5